ncbi:hypothetical protein AVEN_104338-1 [Araneus ventricosus]|uniref:Uncharacterized protein n=1 Tax=Araneus ventricosus TaxID=182803 RepID=A0A4Y2BXS3_ARAVE|nr:hypothetical protein AVEN_104338-1 [Araneus ventricosus]
MPACLSVNTVPCPSNRFSCYGIRNRGMGRRFVCELDNSKTVRAKEMKFDDDFLAGIPSANFHATPARGCLTVDRFNMHQYRIGGHGRSFTESESDLESATLRSQSHGSATRQRFIITSREKGTTLEETVPFN